MNRETCRDVPELAGVGTAKLQQGLQEYGQILKQPCWSRLAGPDSLVRAPLTNRRVCRAGFDDRQVVLIGSQAVDGQRLRNLGSRHSRTGPSHSSQKDAV